MYIKYGDKSKNSWVQIVTLYSSTSTKWKLWANFLNAVLFKRGLKGTIGLTNDLIDSGQPRAKKGF